MNDVSLNMNDVSLNKNICAFDNCSKKIRLTNFPCKCAQIYCNFHRDPFKHKCSYDYKETAFKQDRIKDIECKSNKIQKIE